MRSRRSEGRHLPRCRLPVHAQFEAKLEMQLGVVCDTVHASRRRERGAGDGEPSEAEGEEGEAEDEDDGELATAAAAVEHRCHFERSAHLDGSSWSIFSLWHEAVMNSPKYEGQPQRKAALKAVHPRREAACGNSMNYLRGRQQPARAATAAACVRCRASRPSRRRRSSCCGSTRRRPRAARQASSVRT